MASSFQGKPKRGVRRLLVQAETGSTLWGLNLEDKGDRDEMGVVIEPFEEVVGFSPFEQSVFRTAAIREGRHDAKSQPGDLDLVTYSLRKWMRLALKGNPTILTLLYVPRDKWVEGEGLWEHIQFLAPRIVSKQAGKAFLGYLEGQRKKFVKGNPDVHRKELEEKYGYDTKYAMHMLRLGFQGVELLTEGKLQVPMPEETRKFLLEVRQGGSTREGVLEKCGDLEKELEDLLVTSPLPNRPDSDYMEKYMLHLYWCSWLGKYGQPNWSLQEDLGFVPPEWEGEIHEYFMRVRGGANLESKSATGEIEKG